MSQSQGESLVYGLYAVLVHSGFSCHAGHYFCYIKVTATAASYRVLHCDPHTIIKPRSVLQGSNGQWYQMNDSSVSVSDIRTVLNQQAYVLFYIK